MIMLPCWCQNKEFIIGHVLQRHPCIQEVLCMVQALNFTWYTLYITSEKNNVKLIIRKSICCIQN